MNRKFLFNPYTVCKERLDRMGGDSRWESVFFLPAGKTMSCCDQGYYRRWKLTKRYKLELKKDFCWLKEIISFFNLFIDLFFMEKLAAVHCAHSPSLLASFSLSLSLCWVFNPEYSMWYIWDVHLTNNPNYENPNYLKLTELEGKSQN